jgi:hypothetical protein
MSIGERHLGVLRKLHERLQGPGVAWAITGSLHLALRGLPVEVRDIDVRTDEAGAYEMERLFRPYVTRPVALRRDEAIRSHYGQLMIDGITVDVMGDVELRDAKGRWQATAALDSEMEFVKVAGLRIPVRSMEAEHQAYERLGRVEKAQMVTAWLEREGGEQSSAV